MDEVWKDIEGYEGLYQVSDLGRIKRLSRQIKGNAGCYTVEEMIMKQQLNNCGYPTVALRREKKYKTELVHRLVAIAFIENPNQYRCVNHKDETRNNNTAENLEWCTHSYNNLYGSAREKRIASTNWVEKAKQSSKAVLQLSKSGNIIKKWDSIKEAAQNVNSHTSNIIACCQGKQITSKGYMWKYADRRAV